MKKRPANPVSVIRRSPSYSTQVTSAAALVLDLLRERDFKSATELRQISGLTPGDFTDAIQLLERKRLIERAESRAAPQRSRPQLIRICAEYGHVVAVDIGGTNLRLVIADLAGAIVGKWSASTVNASSAPNVIQLIQTGVKQILQQTSLRQDSLLAVAAGAPGVTDANNGMVLLTSYLGGWKDVPLARMLEEALGVPATIENDVRLGALGERWRGSARGLNDFVFLAIGTGIAAGIYLNGELLHGPEWVAGEVGYLIVPGTSEAGVREGTPGALEAAIGGEGIKALWQQQTQRMYGEALNNLNATEIFERAAAGDELAKSVLDRSARILAYAVYNISAVLNCSLFILGGGVGSNAILREATESVLDNYTAPARPKLCLSSLGPDAQLIGAVRLALDTAERRLGIRV